MSDDSQTPHQPAPSSEWSRAKRWQYFGMALSPLLLMPLGEWLSWRDSFTHHIGLLIGWLEIIPMAGPFAAVPVCLIGLCWQQHRRNAAWGLLCWLVAFGSFTSGFMLARPTKDTALGGVMSRAEPLIAAIQKYEAAQGRPPAELVALVPEYLPNIPTPGIGTSPEFHYRRPAPEADLEGNPWMLQVRPPVAGIGFDIFIYLPRQNYPKRGWGGALERIGTWAYVHE